MTERVVVDIPDDVLSVIATGAALYGAGPQGLDYVQRVLTDDQRNRFAKAVLDAVTTDC